MSQPYPPQQPYQQHLPHVQQHPSNAAHPARGTATAAVWFAVLGLFCFPIIPSIVAWVLADNATRAGYPGGRARAARVLAGLALLVDAAALVVYALRAVVPG